MRDQRAEGGRVCEDQGEDEGERKKEAEEGRKEKYELKECYSVQKMRKRDREEEEQETERGRRKGEEDRVVSVLVSIEL